jgi:GNAT superfamily N-acetyltransferase
MSKPLAETTLGRFETRSMAPGELGRVVAVTAAAFLDSDLYRWVADGGAGPRPFVEAIFGYRVELGASYGQVDVVLEDGAVVGAAVWTPPDTFVASHEAAKRQLAAMGPMTRAVSGFPARTRERWLGFFDLFLSARDAVVSQPYWALTPIAVLPGSQGRGAASSLLRPRLAAMGAVGETCFLGCQDAHSRDIYLCYGFEIVREDPVADSRLVSWSMVRRPGAPLPPPGRVKG